MKTPAIPVLFIFVLLNWSLSFSLKAQHDEPLLTEMERTEVVASVTKLLKDNYVFPDVADKMATLVNSNMKKGVYRSISRPMDLAERLTQDLQSISKDKHLRVLFDPATIERQKYALTAADSLKIKNDQIDNYKSTNFGFRELKILEGNIGYLDLRGFIHPDYARETAVAAMNFLSNTDAVIIDLRYNGGGSPAMIQLISSYFFAEPVHLNTFYFRPTNEYTQTWTFPHVPGSSMPDVDVYILTSNYTFSAAEEFSYNFKNLNRATLIGETTGGGAHPGGARTATERFRVWIPTGKAINPITKTNWEGTGVVPHIETSKEDALLTAKIHALEKLKNNGPEEKRGSYDWHITSLKSQQAPIQLQAEKLEQYVGTYGLRSVVLDEDRLFYQRTGPKYELIPLGEDLFGIQDLPNFRVQFIKENNKVVALKGLYAMGHEDLSLKDSEEFKNSSGYLKG